MSKTVILLALFVIAFSQVTINYYEDSACTKLTLTQYFPPNVCRSGGSTSSFKTQCSADKKTAVASFYKTGDCSGNVESSNTITTFSETCTRTSDFVYIKSFCSSSAISTSNVVSSRLSWASGGGCSTPPPEIQYAYGGCFRSGNTTYTKRTCENSLNGGHVTAIYSDSACTTQTNSQKEDVVKCAFGTYGLLCGFVSGSSSLMLNFVVVALASAVYFLGF